MVAFNRTLLTKRKFGSHYIIFGIVNYNPGECDEYYVTVYDREVKIDREFCRKYVEAAERVGQKVFRWSLYNKEVMKWYKEQGISKAELLRNMKAIEVINKIMEEVESKGKGKEKGRGKGRSREGDKGVYREPCGMKRKTREIK